MVAEDVLDESRVDVREASTAELVGPGHPDPAGLSERAGDLARVAVRGHALATPLGVCRQGGAQVLGERRRFFA